MVVPVSSALASVPHILEFGQNVDLQTVYGYMLQNLVAMTRRGVPINLENPCQARSRVSGGVCKRILAIAN